jgi:hypothetical protein
MKIKFLPILLTRAKVLHGFTKLQLLGNLDESERTTKMDARSSEDEEWREKRKKNTSYDY